jgi:PAS domain S-box-containing protein
MIVPPDRREENCATLERAGGGQAIEEYETIRRAKNGRRIHVSLCIRPVKSRIGEIVGFAKITRDLTAKRFAEEKFRLAVEACPNGMVIVDRSGKIVMLNGAIERQFGYAPAELIGQAIEILVAERIREQHARQVAGFLQKPETLRLGAGYGLFGRRKDGSEFPVEIGLNPIETREGLLILGVVVDITERERAQEMFRLAVEAHPSGAVLVDGDGKIVMVNAETERLFGYPREEMIGRPVDMLAPARFQSQHVEYRAQFVRRPETRRMGANRDLFAVRRDGTEFPVEVGLNPIQNGDRPLVLSVIVDISERKRIEQLKDEFVSTVSHELRTPLTSIAASLGLLAGNEGIKLPEPTKRLITIAHSNSQRLVRLINDILDIEKIESGEVTFNMQTVEVRTLIAQAIEANRGLADDHGVNMRFDEGSACEVSADPDRLMQVVTSLLSNAIKFSPRGGDVIVSLERLGKNTRINVRDSGPGIPASFRSRIFQKFAQAAGSNARQKGGSGLGLSIVRQIMLRLGGNVGFIDAPGGGTIFHVELPAYAGEGGGLA